MLKGKKSLVHQYYCSICGRETLVNPLAWQRENSMNVNRCGRVCHRLAPPMGSTHGPGVGNAPEQPSDSQPSLLSI